MGTWAIKSSDIAWRGLCAQRISRGPCHSIVPSRHVQPVQTQLQSLQILRRHASTQPKHSLLRPSPSKMIQLIQYPILYPLSPNNHPSSIHKRITSPHSLLSWYILLSSLSCSTLNCLILSLASPRISVSLSIYFSRNTSL